MHLPAWILICPVAQSSADSYLASAAWLESQNMHREASAMFASLCNSVHYCQYLHHQHSLPRSSWVPTLCVCRCALCVFPAVADIVSVAFTTLFLVALLTTTWRMITAAINRRIQRRLRIFQSVTVSSECQPGLKRQLLT